MPQRWGHITGPRSPKGSCLYVCVICRRRGGARAFVLYLVLRPTSNISALFLFYQATWLPTATWLWRISIHWRRRPWPNRLSNLTMATCHILKRTQVNPLGKWVWATCPESLWSYASTGNRTHGLAAQSPTPYRCATTPPVHNPQTYQFIQMRQISTTYTILLILRITFIITTALEHQIQFSILSSLSLHLIQHFTHYYRY